MVNSFSYFLQLYQLDLLGCTSSSFQVTFNFLYTLLSLLWYNNCWDSLTNNENSVRYEGVVVEVFLHLTIRGTCSVLTLITGTLQGFSP